MKDISESLILTIRSIWTQPPIHHPTKDTLIDIVLF